jgi:hypothetical protein
MENVITLGRKLVPIEHIALVEPFDPAANPEFKPERPFKSRVVFLDRETTLTEMTSQEFAETHGFRMLADDDVATNPGIMFRVETFEPTEEFKPAKPYQTRLKWRDPDGNEQSKLLITKPEIVIAVALRGETESRADRKLSSRRPNRPRTSRQRTTPRADA